MLQFGHDSTLNEFRSGVHRVQHSGMRPQSFGMTKIEDELAGATLLQTRHGRLPKTPGWT